MGRAPSTYSLPCVVHNAEADEAVIAGTLLAVINEDFVFVLGLKETAHRSLHQAVFLDELVAVIALLQQDGSMIILMHGIVLHLAVGIERLPCPPPTHIHIATLQARRLEEEVHDDIFSCRLIIIIV